MIFDDLPIGARFNLDIAPEHGTYEKVDEMTATRLRDGHDAWPDGGMAVTLVEPQDDEYAKAEAAHEHQEECEQFDQPEALEAPDVQ